MLLEDAYRDNPEAPKFVGSEHIMGFRDTDHAEVINPAALKFRAQRLKSQNDQNRESRLQREEGGKR